MGAGWTWPLVTSVLRLVFISTLTVVNGAALYRLISTNKYKQGQRHDRILVMNIIVVGLVYLAVVWAPFTFTALKHDLGDLYQIPRALEEDLNLPFALPKLQDLHDDIKVNNLKNREKEDDFTVEYIDILPPHDIFPDPNDIQDEITVEYIDGDDGIHESDYNEFTMEYIDITTGEPVKKETSLSRKTKRAAAPEKLEAAWTVFFHSQPEGLAESTKNDIPSGPMKGKSVSSPSEMSRERKSDTLYWSSNIQDLVTSSCAYSLAFTAVLRLIIKRKFMLCSDGPLMMGMWSGLAVGIPGVVTLLVRTVTRTTTHFAPHQPEYTTAGYFLYNIICDVHISEEYVVSVFLEWAALFTLLLLCLAVMYGVAIKTSIGGPNEENYGPLHNEGNPISNNVESWARDVVLLTGAVWSWPLKPLLVLILYCIYGSHWTNLVCWIGHVVVAVPVVFIPLAVFLSRSQHGKSSLNVYVIDADPSSSSKTTHNEKEEEARQAENAQNHFDDVGKVQNTDMNHFYIERLANDEPAAMGSSNAKDGRDQAKENLKFYLGKDIFKYGLKPTKPEDRQIILSNEWGETSISEA